jgi:chemotaxis protein methyltransferase CheR
MLNTAEIEQIIKDLLEIHGHDFSFYSRDSLNRRINRFYQREKCETFSWFSERLRKDRLYVEYFIDHITVNVTEMFRDKLFFAELREIILPELAGRKKITVWHAGCSTGEEVYSTAILFSEAGLLHKTSFVATDINPQALKKAALALFPSSLREVYAKNYRDAGGKLDFSEYHRSTSKGEKFSPALRGHAQFSRHNLASDPSPGKFDLILCRNVIIYFDKGLQKTVFRLFSESLRSESYLALGEKETLVPPFNKKFMKPGKEAIWKLLP